MNKDISNSTDKYVVLALGMHVVRLISENKINVAAVLDVHNNGSLEKAGINEICSRIYRIGFEKKIPLISSKFNIEYYQKIKSILNQHNTCKVIISGNHYPLARFIIDTVGVNRIELWEDGLNHYVKIEKRSWQYWTKSIYKLFCGFYPKGIFNPHYKEDQLVIKDRFFHKNLKFHRPIIPGSKKYYIGQPLIENHYIRESVLKEKLHARFKGKGVIYIPHSLEQTRPWLHDIFLVLNINQSAEAYLLHHGAKAIYSAFSTVNMNISCQTNVFLCKYLGLQKITKQLEKYNFDIVID